MDNTIKFQKIIREIGDHSDMAEACNELHNRELKQTIKTFAEWLIYDDEIFELFATNKISSENLYNRFCDELKL